MARNVQVTLIPGSYRAKNGAGKRSLVKDVTKVIHVEVDWSDHPTERFGLIYYDHGQNRDVYCGYSAQLGREVVLKIRVVTWRRLLWDKVFSRSVVPPTLWGM